MKSILFLLVVVPMVYCSFDNDLNKPHKDKYVLQQSCELQIHRQINEEMHASLVYATMAAHFDQNGVARKGIAKFFADSSVEEREHAHKLIDYLNRRGSRFLGFDIKMPAKNVQSWNTALDAFIEALSLENKVNNKLYHLHDKAAEAKDQHLMDFIEGEFLDEQVKSIDELTRYISILSGMNTSMGEYLFDLQLQGHKTEL